MKVLVPLNNLEHATDYIESGAGEFYIGFYDEEWYKEFGEYGDMNRMSGFHSAANKNSLEDVCKIISDMKQKGVSMYITFNASSYSQKQLQFMKRFMERLKDAKADGVIVTCMELVQIAKQVGIPSVVSTIGGIYNEDIARFYRDLGVSRIILPRDLSLDEIESIVRAVPEVEYEIFMMRNGCIFSDANCLGLHRQEYGSMCSTLCNGKSEIYGTKNDFKSKHDAELNDLIYTGPFHAAACGLCSIYRFVQLGIAAGKIVGRTEEWEKICSDIKMVQRNVEIAKTCSSEEEYLEKMELPENEKQMCKLGLSCYYPEVRF